MNTPGIQNIRIQHLNDREVLQGHLRFRPATAADFPRICDLVTSPDELFLVYPRGHFPLTIEQLQELARVRTALTVALEETDVDGFANFYDYTAGHKAFIGNVIIDQTRRGHGLGKRLVRYMLDLGFHEHQLPVLEISVFGHNAPAMLLYAGLGFLPYAVEERRDFSNRRVALVQMRMDRSTWQNRQEEFSSHD